MAMELPNNIETLAKYIDHTLLRPDATEAEISQACDEAMKYRVRALCIERKWLSFAVAKLSGKDPMVITVVGFPEGNQSTYEKEEQTQSSIRAGAREIDMVLNRDLLKEKDYSAVYRDIGSVVQACAGAPLKVILETSELNQDEKIAAVAICKAAGASYVKTSTGFSKSGATIEDVALMRRVGGEDLGVKASGGVRSLDDALKMIEAGATRIGMSATVKVLEDFKNRLANG